MSRLIYAPIPSECIYDGVNIFLAGSIDMGKALNWQPVVTEALKDIPEVGEIYNPRRLDFQEGAEQSITNPYFSEQVNWELDHLDLADIVFMYLDPESKAPISLMEMGYMSKTDKLIVCCPDGFWRKGNIEIMCFREGIFLFDNLIDALDHLKKVITKRYGELFP
jgi:hypothetical protein